MMDFSPFWNTISERGITTYDLEYTYGLNPAEISRLKHNHNFTINKIGDYCKLFQCKVEDIVIYVEEK